MLKKLIQKYKDSDVVFKASIWFVLVTVINNAASLLTQPIVNRILSVEEVGVYGVYLTWSSILSILSTFNLCYGVLEVLITKDKADSDNIVSSLSTVSSIIWTVFFALVFIFIDPISALLKLKPIYIVILALTVWADAMVQFWCVKKRFFYLYRQYSALMVALFVTKSALSVTLAYLIADDRVLGRVLGMCLPPLFAAVVLYVSSLKRTGLRGITKYWKRGINFNIPLIPHYLSSILLASSDKIMIQHLSDETSLGLYSLAYTFSGLALIVFTAVNNAYTPIAYELIRAENYKELSKKTKPIIFIAVAFSVLLMLMAPEGIYIIGGEEYMSCLEIVPVLVLGIFFSSFYFIFSIVRSLALRLRLLASNSFCFALSPLFMIFPDGVLPQTQTGNSFGQVQPTVNFLNVSLTALSSREWNVIIESLQNCILQSPVFLPLVAHAYRGHSGIYGRRHLKKQRPFLHRGSACR
jgi:O-antigen/teichoic acid export membrane protein